MRWYTVNVLSKGNQYYIIFRFLGSCYFKGAVFISKMHSQLGVYFPKCLYKRILDYAGQVPEADRAKFIEVVETELLSLHEGNFARYRIRPSEFAAWKVVWDGKEA